MTFKRIFLFVAAIFVSFSTHAMSSKSKSPIPQVSVQLHSVKDAVNADFEGTLKALSEMGFDGVEFAGRYGPYKDDPKGLKSFLDSLGLKASGVHILLNQINTENAAKHFQFFKDLGTKLVIIPYDDRSDDPELIDQLISELNALSLMANDAGLILGFHNHAKEFNTFKDTTFWDYIAQNTDNSFLLQLDVGWSNLVGVDSIGYVKRYPKRTLTTHYKVRTRKDRGKVPTKPVTIGEDGYDWPALIKANMQYGATRWIVVEQEEYPEGLTPLQSVAASKKGLDAIIKKMGY